MNTNYTTTTAAARMTAAHALARRALETAPETARDYRATFAAALKIAWEVMPAPIQTAAAETETAPATARAEWDAMSGDAQNAALIAMVWHMRDRDTAATMPDGTPVAQHMQWIHSADDAQTVANEAWLRMPAALDRAERVAAETETEPRPLPVIICKAVWLAAQYLHRVEIRHASALTSTTDADGNTVEVIDITADATAERVSPSPEVYTIERDAIIACAADDIDREIIRRTAYGYTQTEIAAAVGIKQPNVNKRLAKIRARYDADKTAAAQNTPATTTATAPAAPARIAYHPAPAAPAVQWLTHAETTAARHAAALDRAAHNIPNADNDRRFSANLFRAARLA